MQILRAKNKSLGFTLIELLVVIAIIGILAAVVLVSLNSARAKSRDARRLSDMHQMQTALELYYNDCGAYPSQTVTLGAAAAKTLSSGLIAGTSCTNGGFLSASTGTTYAAQAPADPTPTQNYVYTPAGSNTSYTIQFSLEGTAGGLASGARTASPSGIQ